MINQSDQPTSLDQSMSIIEFIYSEAAHSMRAKGEITTSKIKHAIKRKTSPARLAQLLQPSLTFCFSLQPITACRPGLDGTLSLAAC